MNQRRSSSSRRAGRSSSGSPTSAVSALGVGADSGKWLPATMIAAMTTRYLDLVKQATEAKDRDQKVRYRVYMSGAYELASIITDWHQAQSDTETFNRWESRRERAHYAAYHVGNVIADRIDTGGLRVHDDIPPDMGVFAPRPIAAGAPRPVIDRMHGELVKALNLPDVRRQLTETMGMELVVSTPDALQKFLLAEMARWAKVVRAHGIKPD